MTPNECAILTFFRQYDIGPSQMLFFNPGDCKLGAGSFRTGMESLMKRGLVVKERHKLAYSLTRPGYDLAVTLPRPKRASNLPRK